MRPLSFPRTVALFLLLAGTGVQTAHAQVNRALWLVQIGYVGDAVLATGLRWVYAPAPQVRTDPTTGMTLPVSSRTSLHASATGGVSLGGHGERDVDWTGQGSLGFVKPMATGPLSGAGLIAMGSLQPDGVGPGLRVESGFHAFGLNAGVLFDHHTARFAATFDIAAVFLSDLFR
jgi:hypothetical protein